MKNITLNLSHEVSDIENGKKRTFDPEIIVPLKQELLRQAIVNDNSIEPCSDDHFSINNNNNELIFWYNSHKDNSTKMIKIKIGN